MSTSDEAVVIWGEVLWDRFPDGDRLGGAPANVAWHLGQAGGWARLVTRVGADADGRRAIDALEAHVDTSLVQVDAERATGEVTVVVEDGEPRYTLHADRAWERIAWTPEAAAAIEEAGVLIYGTLAQRTADGLASWRHAIDAASTPCLKVCDVNLRRTAGGFPALEPAHPGRPRAEVALAEAIDAADLVKVNDRELDAIGAWLGWSDPIAGLRDRRPIGHGSTLRPRGDAHRIVAVTHGAAGSTLYGDAAAIELAGVAASAPGDHVGCGDGYLAILVLGMTMGWDLEASGRAATRWAAAIASARGATPAFDDEHRRQLLEPA